MQTRRWELFYWELLLDSCLDWWFTARSIPILTRGISIHGDSLPRIRPSHPLIEWMHVWYQQSHNKAGLTEQPLGDAVFFSMKYKELQRGKHKKEKEEEEERKKYV